MPTVKDGTGSTVNHHWIGLRPNPKKAFGFLYEITNLETGRQYLGRKQYHRYRKRKRIGDNDWHTYTGSSKDLNEDIRRLGRGCFCFRLLRNFLTTFTMLISHFSIKGLAYLVHADGKSGIIAYFVVTVALAALLKWWQDRKA